MVHRLSPGPMTTVFEYGLSRRFSKPIDTPRRTLTYYMTCPLGSVKFEGPWSSEMCNILSIFFPTAVFLHSRMAGYSGLMANYFSGSLLLIFRTYANQDASFLVCHMLPKLISVASSMDWNGLDAVSPFINSPLTVYTTAH